MQPSCEGQALLTTGKPGRCFREEHSSEESCHILWIAPNVPQAEPTTASQCLLKTNPHRAIYTINGTGAMLRSILRSSVLFAVFLLPHGSSQAQWMRVLAVDTASCDAVITVGDTIYAAFGNVVWLSTDRGSTWTSTPPIDDPPVVTFALLPTPAGLLAGTLSNGVYRFENGSRWTRYSDGLTGLGALSIGFLVIRDSLIYAGTFGAGIFRVGRSLASPWLPFRDGMPSNIAWNIVSLSNINGTLFAGGGANAMVYLNSPAATNWTEIQFAPFAPTGTSFLASAEHRSIIHAVGSQGLHRSTDGGATWKTFNPGIGLIEIGGFAPTPSGFHALLSKAGSSFLYRLDANDSTWTLIDSEPMAAFSTAAAGNTLFAGRINGLYTLNVASTSVDGRPDRGEPGGFALDQNYPNPFNPTTVFRYRVPVAGKVRLAVYDLLGRELAVPVSEWKAPGTYEVTFDAAGLPSGVYLYRLLFGSYVQTRSMIVIK